MNIKQAKTICDNYICNTYPDRKLLLTHGSGCFVYDSDGKKYLDFLSGLAVSSLGHGNKFLAKALVNQAQKLIHTSNLYHNIPQLELAQLLGKRLKEYKLFFCNSGAEANEAAIKLSRKYHSNPDKTEIITFKNSFHGRTIATVTATGQTKYNEAFKPLLPTFHYADFNNMESVVKLVSKKTGAIMLELIQCEGGVNIADKKFIKDLFEFCKKKGILLIIDEVQTGSGRTGKFFSFQHFGITPDIFSAAKGIAGGVPMGIMFAKKNIAAAFKPGDHASTFGGTPLVCAAALEVVKFLSPQKLKEIHAKGEYFKKILNKEKHPLIKNIRGIGLMIGIELNTECAAAVQATCEKNGLILNSIQNKILRLAPPLIVTNSELDAAVKIIVKSLYEIEGCKK